MQDETPLLKDPEFLSKVWQKVLKMLKPGHGFTGVQINEAIKEALKGMTVFDHALGVLNSEILCEKCGVCCRICNPIFLEPGDIQRISSFLRMSVADFHLRYVETDGERFFFKYSKPCRFLRGNLCTIYPARPNVCRVYPFNQSTKKLVFEKECGVPVNLVAFKTIGFLVKKRFSKEMDRKMKGYMDALYEKAKTEHPNADEIEISWYIIQEVLRGFLKRG